MIKTNEKVIDIPDKGNLKQYFGSDQYLSVTMFDEQNQKQTYNKLFVIRKNEVFYEVFDTGELFNIILFIIKQ